MSEIKLCPLLVQKREIKAIMIGDGDLVVTYLSPCIEDECAAYKSGYCYQFGNTVKGQLKEQRND